MDLAEEPRKIKIDGTEHEWIENLECDYNHCRRKKEDITWCDAWKTVDSIEINVGDVWKDATKVEVNIGDTWKTVF